MAKDTCENHIAELQRFFRWLHRSKAYSWRKPDDYDDLKTLVKSLPEERTSVVRRTERKFYLPDELAIINKYATPLERLLLLLGLNCGFKGAEMGTLLPGHLFLDEPHPNADYLSQVSEYDCRPSDRFIIYSRNKTTVDGEFLLWPQTVTVLRWALERRDRIVNELSVPYPNLLITEQGTLFHRITKGEKNRSQIFNNKWRALLKRIQRDYPEFKEFPFKSLRQTASDLVRQVADGETAAVFLMHGQPVREDDLIDLYTKRPFGKVFEALRELENGKLKGVLDAAPDDPIAQPAQQYTPLKRQEQIVQLKKDGKSVPEIAEVVGVSKHTVTRTLTRLYYKPKKKKAKS
ncbi:MAG: helix-turn-helix domain-containing protein [Planctomycetaceae bacterium]